GEGLTAENELVVHDHPPWAAVRTSTRSPGRRTVSGQALRTTTSALTATATPRRSAPRSERSWATVVPGDHSYGSPLTVLNASPSLRRHDPDQVRTVGGACPPLSPWSPGSRGGSAAERTAIFRSAGPGGREPLRRKGSDDVGGTPGGDQFGDGVGG